MNFELSEEQQMLVDSISKFLQNDYDFETRRKLAASELGYSADNWKTFAELGWLSVPFAEENGGFGGSAIDVMLMMEAFGKALITEPFIPTVILGGRLVELLGSAEQKESLLASVIQGELQMALAYDEPGARGNPACVAATAEPDGDSYRISGRKVMVLNGHAADKLLVTARTGGALTDADGISVFVVDSADTGVEATPYFAMEGGRAANIALNGAKGELLGSLGAALPAVDAILDEAVIAMGSEAVGAMEVLYKTTVEYCKTRKQFGVPIGKFQVLQHRMVEMFMAHELTQSSMYMAGLRNLEGGDIAKKAASAFKVQVGKSGRYIGQQAVQLHGGMGMTDELNVGFYFKRLTAIDALLGNMDYHLNRYASVA